MTTHKELPASQPAAMRPMEYDVLGQLVRDVRPENTLEVGMANGQSTIEICRAAQQIGAVNHVSIDPFQSQPDGWGGRGITAVNEAGFGDAVELIEDFDYLALPRLVTENRKFEFILLDGWHSFDFTLTDFFFADLLLATGGVVVFHDSALPAVHKVCRFVETHKAYELVSPPPSVELNSITSKIIRRAATFLKGREARKGAHLRRTRWYSLAAYRKLKDLQVGNTFFESF